MRITGGAARGRPLRAPRGLRVRPTADKVRAAIFNILATRIDIAQSRWLDLFAGSGALGLEALSRGAAHVMFVDESRESCRFVRENVERSGFAQRVEVRRVALPGGLRRLHIEEPFPWFRKQVEVLARACGATVRAVADLRDIRSVPSAVTTIKREEREGDWVYRRAVADLYSGDYRPLEVLMWRDLLEQVEAAIDRCEDVSNQIESVAAKFA